MSKDKKRTNSFVGNVLMLMISQIIIKLLGLIYRLAITNVKGFGDLGNGYYSAGYQVYAVLLIISSQGIPGAVSKLVSNKVAQGKYNEAHRIFKVSLWVFGIIGLIASLLLYFLSDFISMDILNVKDVTYVLKVLSPAIFFVCVSAVIRGYFAGLGTMKASSISQALEQFFNCVLTITFVYALVGKEPYVMAAGGNLSTTLAILISFSYLLLFYKTNIKKYKEESNDVVDTSKSATKKLSKIIIMTAIPLTVGSIISVVTTLIDTITVSNCIQIAYKNIFESKYLLEQEAMRLTGILSKVETIVNLPIAVNLSFYSALIPAITAAISKKDYESASKKISFSISTSLLIVLPCAIGFITLADPILKMLYPNASDGAHIFQIAAFTMIFVAINHTLQGSLFGLGKMYTPALALTCGSIVKIILNLILIRNPNINIYGAAVSSLICQVITFTIIYITLKRTIRFKMDKRNNLIKPIIASLLMGFVIILIQYIFKGVLGNSILTMISIIIGAIVYLFLVVILKILKKDEIYALPKGEKIYNMLVKLKLYKA
ncbi:MAG: polysaccharide biosynthesis protein [Bacilli bacterium]|nr:polysaccharide biosynthesis protein [Bacilli bacterium]